MIPIRILDLYCGAGGAAMGYAKAGFTVVGVDIAPQPRYPFRFIQGDALDVLGQLDLSRFDAIHASPPCQRFTKNAKQRGTAADHPDLLAPTRERLDAAGLPYVIENVPEAPLVDPVTLCGNMFDLGVWRHRGFETNWDLIPPQHPPHNGYIGDGRHYTVAGHTGWNSTRDGRFGGTIDHWKWAMDIAWMSARELAEAIPPAFTRYIGAQLRIGLQQRVNGVHHHVVMFSSGAGSAVAAKRVADRYGPENVTLLFADVNGEHPDNHRFLHEAAEWIGAELVILDNGGRTIWDVFREVRFLGNSRIDPCSRVLKREPMRRWLEENCHPRHTTVYLGFDWTEAHRHDRALHYWDPWLIESPLMWDPYADKGDALQVLADAGIEPPWLTRQGFPHANCGGGCVKAGIGQFKQLLKKDPETYARWEAGEQKMRELLGPIAILRDRSGGTVTPLPLTDLRLRVQADPSAHEGEDWGGCNCMTPPEPERSGHEEEEEALTHPPVGGTPVTIHG